MNYKSQNTKAGNNCTEGSTKGSQSLVDAKERLRSSSFHTKQLYYYFTRTLIYILGSHYLLPISQEVIL